MRRSASLVLMAVLFIGAAWSAEITVDNVIQLKQLGFTDAEVRSEIDKSGTRYALTAADVERLRKAGVGDELLRAMQGPEKAALTVEVIEAMAQEGRTTEAILRAIAESGATFTLTPAQALALSGKGVSQAVLMAMGGRRLGVEDLKRLAADGLSEEGFTSLAAIVGFNEQPPSAGQALDLLEAGVPRSIVTMFREGTKPELTASRSDGLKEYRHVGRQFTLRFPGDWNVVRSLDEGTVTYAATPQQGAIKADDLDVCFEVGLLYLGGGIADRGRDVVETMKHILPLLRFNEPDMEPKGDIQKASLGRLDAARLRLEGRRRDRTGEFTTDLYLASQNGVHYMAVCRAPRASFAAHEAIFEQIRNQSDFGRPLPGVRTRTFEASDLVERYKGSIVSVLCDFGGGRLGSGTGFVIHPDGYVATNAHVIRDEDGRPAQRYTIQWDQSISRKEVDAELIGWQFGQERMFFHWGADVALLRLPPGDYTAVPLTPLDEVRLGDPVVAIGFPQRFRFDTLNIFITGGVVTRFNRDREGHIDSIFTDAKIAKGNSGGPCFSRVTGGVIGQNTYGMPIQVKQENVRLNELVGYSGVIPVQYLMDRFPLVAELGLPLDPSLDFLDSYALSSFLLNRHPGDDAQRLASRAVKLRPDSADARFLLGSCLLGTEGPQAAMKAFNEALTADPDHMETLLILCQLHVGREEFVQASQCADRAVRAHPKLWRTHFAKGQLLLTLQRYDEALRAANTAINLVHGVLAEPHILAGQIAYAQGDLAAGRQHFERASEIHPTNLAARFGIGEYFERQNNYPSALLEYGKLEREFANDPLVMKRLGRCCKKMERWDKAAEYYTAALNRIKELGGAPDEEVYFELGYIHWNVRRSQQVIWLYGDYLAFHGDSPRAWEVHMQLADALLSLVPDRAGVPYGHLSRAWTLRPDTPQIKAALERPALRPMSLEDIVFMLNNCEYHPTVVADIVSVTKLNFRIDLNNEQHIQTLQKNKIPVVVIRAILLSNQRQGTAQALPNQPGAPAPPKGQAGQGDQAAGPAPAGPPQVLAALAGTWRGQTSVVFLKYDLTLTFTPDGGYTLVSHDLNDGTTMTISGTFTATASSLTMTSDEGSRTQTTYNLAGNRLVIQEIIGYIRPITFTKQ